MGRIVIDTQLDTTEFENAIKKMAGALAIKKLTEKVVSIGADFESTMSQVSAISGATGDDLAALTQKAKDMGAKTKFSANDCAEAMTYMGMAGWDSSQMISGLDGILNLAAASGEDLGSVSDILTDSLTAFGLSASDSAHFADILAAASSNSNTNVSLLGRHFAQLKAA